ncbi:hypothetical protein L6164_035841 [Bauhinia variegata]|uniref:Uncharacterized protein n=1 Tax=Bauhinia variegata TaxID=167791 RepID=A0ACB9KFB6_BAUVA|nr:hypothetical protein L6164_035841 [Bauhinia variegata]
MAMAATARRASALLGASTSISYLRTNKKAYLQDIFALYPRRSGTRDFSVCSTDQTGASKLRLEDDSGCSGDQFHKWHNGGGTFHESACVDPTALIEVGAIVHSKCFVGASVLIGSGTVVGPSVTIGHSTKIGYNVALSNCSLGESCVVHNGVCIGQDGFGFYVDGDGNMIKKPQMLNVIIGKHVEIGANTCIDRGSWRDTVIGDYSKIDNLVQIGHNVVIGKNCMLCGQVGIAGSATIGDYVTMGGRVAVRDHVSIVSKVRLAATSCVTRDIKEPGTMVAFQLFQFTNGGGKSLAGIGLQEERILKFAKYPTTHK